MQKPKAIRLKNSKDIAKALGLTQADHNYMIYKLEMSELAMKSTELSSMSVSEIVEKSGVARSKVSAIKNGVISGITIDLMVRVILATGRKLKAG